MTIPAPLTPPECDLRNFPYMPLDVVRLRDSDMSASEDPEIFRTAVLAWCVSWHQIPAASLPDDDAAIARLVGMGRDVEGLRRLRAAGALRGFVKCSDGRLYHPVVAEKAMTSWQAKQAQRDRTEKARQVRLSQNKSLPVTDVVTERVTEIVTDPVTASNVREGKGEEGKDKITTSLRSAVIPDWIPQESWTAFVEMRRKIKAPLTEHGKLLIVAKLLRLGGRATAAAILDQSTMNSWKGVFPVKHDGADARNNQKSSNLDNTLAGIELALAGAGGTDDGPKAPEDAEPQPDACHGPGGEPARLDHRPAPIAARAEPEGMGEPVRDLGAGVPARRDQSRTSQPEIPDFLRRSGGHTWAGNSRGLRALSAGTEPGREAEILPPELADHRHV